MRDIAVPLSRQLGFVALEIEKILAVEAKERQGARTDLNISQRIEQSNDGKASEQAAKIVGTNRQYVSDAEKIREVAPDLEEKVMAGDMAVLRVLAV